MERRQITTATFIGLLAALTGFGPVQADEPAQQTGDNTACLACHGSPSLTHELPSGEEQPLYIDEDIFRSSVHGQQELSCRACHIEISGYPHPAITAWDARSLQIEQSVACRRCHPEQYESAQDGVHARALADGNQEAALCSDCHGAHDVAAPDEPRQRISVTCAKCHADIFERYSESVHGAALMDENNSDVPTCIDSPRCTQHPGPRNQPLPLRIATPVRWLPRR